MVLRAFALCLTYSLLHQSPFYSNWHKLMASTNSCKFCKLWVCLDMYCVDVCNSIENAQSTIVKDQCRTSIFIHQKLWCKFYFKFRVLSQKIYNLCPYKHLTLYCRDRCYQMIITLKHEPLPNAIPNMPSIRG